MASPIYAIGDIHGYAAELERVLTLIEEDGGPGRSASSRQNRSQSEGKLQ